MKKCISCNNTMIVTSPAQKYCRSCRVIEKQIYDNTYHKRKYFKERLLLRELEQDFIDNPNERNIDFVPKEIIGKGTVFNDLKLGIHTERELTTIGKSGHLLAYEKIFGKTGVRKLSNEQKEELDEYKKQEQLAKQLKQDISSFASKYITAAKTMGSISGVSSHTLKPAILTGMCVEIAVAEALEPVLDILHDILRKMKEKSPDPVGKPIASSKRKKKERFWQK